MAQENASIRPYNQEEFMALWAKYEHKLNQYDGLYAHSNANPLPGTEGEKRAAISLLAKKFPDGRPERPRVQVRKMCICPCGGPECAVHLIPPLWPDCLGPGKLHTYTNGSVAVKCFDCHVKVAFASTRCPGWAAWYKTCKVNRWRCTDCR